MAFRMGPEFREAARDYRTLLDRGYAGPATLKLVGDRRRLDAEERLILFRGIASTADSAQRRSLLAAPAELEGAILLLDAYNAAFIIMHYLIGKPCFAATDGLVRDAGASYGRVYKEELLERAFAELATEAAALGVSRLDAFLDAPVSRSGGHAALLRAALAAAGLEGSASVAKSADGAIAARLSEMAASCAGAAPALIVATGDSALAARSPRVFDLAAALLAQRYGAELMDLGSFF